MKPMFSYTTHFFRFISPEAKSYQNKIKMISASGEEKQKGILDSIYYARRIQRSLLPTGKYIDKKLNKLNG